MYAQTKSKLIQYGLLSAGATGIAAQANGQVLYTDIEPDVLLYEWEEMGSDQGWQSFDLNLDGQIDVQLYQWYVFICGYCPGAIGFNVELLDGAQIGTVIEGPLSLFSTFQSGSSSSEPACYIPSHAVAKGFQSGDMIDIGDDFGIIEDIWKDYDCGSNGDGGIQIDIQLQGDELKQFLGFKIPIGASYQFGWLRLYLDDEGRLFVTDMAIQQSPNIPLPIDPPVLNIFTEAAEMQNVYWSNGQVCFQTNSPDFDVIQIFSVTGQLLQETNFDKSIGSHRNQVTFTSAPGIYILGLISDKGMHVAQTFIIPD